MSAVDLPVTDGLPAGLEIMQELGSGAHAVVYRARLDGRDYALKVHRDVADGTAATQAFYREAAVLACLRHPGSARIEAVGITEGRPYLVMELLQGRTLREVIDGRFRPLSEAE